ncbi:hypothetical protein D9619_012427 [Psilocybe cf. subviscida]|uniref:NACHT domain-containing protein n=1 Tax=Psilocybe cf. subviscida TaxID=2480587 RepID=A0A8H5ARE7_9AGAR|nr:hypothetical protein D9619_012427 [Psilocybe cf. subviscida]
MYNSSHASWRSSRPPPRCPFCFLNLDMKADPCVEPTYTHANRQATKHTAATSPTDPSVTGTVVSMFNNAKNTYIAGGSFSITTNVNTVNGPSLDVVHKRAAPHAILNAGGRADEVRCHPGTREEVLGRIEKWRNAQDSLTPPIFWLSGPAGAGKTAIVQTVAERCNAKREPQANFFFFRTDSTRNSLSSLVATLVHQIILLYPSLRDSVATVLSTNPLILDSVLEDQLTQLIVTPLEDFRQSSSSYLAPLLLIDGLDECESENKCSQRQILHAFDKVLAERSCPFRLLVASRDESQIRAAFNDISSQFLSLYLDDQFFPDSDIQTFVEDEFKRVRKTHPLANTLNASWPSVQEVEDMVNKSSGHFIYAATVMRFILNSSASPMLSLATVQGAAQISTRSPFSHLDTIYMFILSRVNDQEALKDILHAQLLIQDASQREYGKRTSFRQMELAKLLEVYNPIYTQTRIRSCLADLTPIAQYRFCHLLFHHASFPDYLLDESRSGNYYVDIDAFNIEILPAVWKELQVSTRLSLELEIIAYQGLFRLRQLPPGFLNTLIALDPIFFLNFLASGGADEAANIFKHVYDLCACDDDATKYKCILRQWIDFKMKSEPLEYRLITEGTTNSIWPPCSNRYLAMACIDHDFMIEPLNHVTIALRPETDSDAHETALWLNNLLHRIHREIYHTNPEEYDLRLQEWLSWAAWNNIPMDRAGDLPINAWWYFRQSRIEKWLASRLRLGG